MQCNLQGQTALCGLPSLPASAMASKGGRGSYSADAAASALSEAQRNRAPSSHAGTMATDEVEGQGFEKVPAPNTFMSFGVDLQDAAAQEVLAETSGLESKDTTGRAGTVSPLVTGIMNGVPMAPTTTLDNYIPPECVRAFKSKGASGKIDPSVEEDPASFGKIPLSGFGIEVLKVTSQGKFQPRRLAIHADNRTILINTRRTPSIRGIFKKPDNPLALARRIDVSNIVRVETGQRTRKFGMARSINGDGSTLSSPKSKSPKSKRNVSGPEEKSVNSLSIVYCHTPGAVATSVFAKKEEKEKGGGSKAKLSDSSTTPALETLDLVVPTTRDFEALMLTLHDIMGLYRKYRADTHRDLQILQRLWIQKGISLGGRASSADWVEIAQDGLGASFSKAKLATMFKKYCKAEKIKADKGGVLISQAVGLLKVLREASAAESAKESGAHLAEDPMKRIWEEISSVEASAAKTFAESSIEDSYVSVAPSSLHQVLSQDSDEQEGGENIQANANTALAAARANMGGEETVTAEQYLSFLKTTQGEANVTIVQVHDLFSRLNGQTKLSASSALQGNAGNIAQSDSETVDSANEAQLEKVRAAMVSRSLVTKSTLLHFLLSDANDAFDPEAGTAGQMDMTHPLSAYWINTSHDTYLRRVLAPDGGRGKAGDAAEVDAAMYGEALRRGFRCIEIDLWDAGSDEDSGPVVRFSENAKNSIPLKDILNEVKSFLTFNPRAFPVILSIEDHCTVPVQERAASLLKKVLGDKMFEPDEEMEGEDDDILPSPLRLRGKVVVKSKRPKRIRDGASVLCDDFDIDNDIDPSMSPDVVDEDDISACGDDDIINPVLSMMSEVESPDDKYRAADDDAERAKEAAGKAEERAFNLQVKAKRAAEHSAKLLKKLGWKASEIEEKRAEILAENEGKDPEQQVHESRTAPQGPEAEAEGEVLQADDLQVRVSATSSQEPETPRAVPGKMQVGEPQLVNGQNNADEQEDTVDENGLAAMTPSGSTLFSEDFNGSMTMDERTYDDDDVTKEGRMEGWIDSLWNGEGDPDGVPVSQSYYTDGGDGSTFVSTVIGNADAGPDDDAATFVSKSTVGGAGDTATFASRGTFADGTFADGRGGRSPKKSVKKKAGPGPDEEGLEVELLPLQMTKLPPSPKAVKKTKTSSKAKEEEENLPPPSPAQRVVTTEAGMEVQHFFAESVNQAKLRHSEADEAALIATKAADRAAHALREATATLATAEEELYASVQNMRDLALAADRAASEARSNREHADIAIQRVVTVQDLLSKCEDQAATSETVAVTAVTEANISEERAAEAEKRAARAQSNAIEDRQRADEETRKEEQLEREMTELKIESNQAADRAFETKNKHDRLQAHLIRVDKQIKILEKSKQFQKEREQSEAQRDEEDIRKDGLSLALVRKHQEKKRDQASLTEKLRKATLELESAELNRTSVEDSYYNVRQAAQAQAKRASAARRQADQSTTVSEQLAEYAEEEREAANMRKDACNKAEACVKKSRVHCASMEAQLREAERAAEEAEDLAKTSRQKAEEMAKEALLAKDISKQQEDVDEKRDIKENAEITLDTAKAVSEAADFKAVEAKQHLETAYEVFYQAKRVSAAEAHRFNAERQVEKNAIEAFDTAVALRRGAEEAKKQAAHAVVMAAEKVSAAKRARDYRDKKALVQKVSLDLAEMTLLHSSKFNYWEKSMAIPASHMHSISEGKMLQLTEGGPPAWENWIEFNKNHITRVFPSRHAHLRAAAPNFNPVIAWSLGCQMVALNFQACDDHLLLNDGRFRVNASSGYVLKPERLTHSRKARSVSWKSAVDANAPCKVKVKVLSGYNIPAPENRMGRSGPISPRIRVALYDGTPDESSAPQVHLTSKVKRNGLNPVWNEMKGGSFYASTPDVAMLLITIWDSGDDSVARDDFIAAASMPVSCIREGYRSIPLFDAKHSRSGCHAFSSLLIKVETRQ